MMIMLIYVRLKEHEVEQDEPVCKMVNERKCKEIQGDDKDYQDDIDNADDDDDGDDNDNDDGGDGQ